MIKEICPWHNLENRRPKPFYVTGCKQVLFSAEGGNFNFGHNRDPLALDANFKW